MSNKSSVFSTLYGLNVRDKVEKKGGLDYLSWAYAWAELLSNYPDATRRVYEDPATGWNYFSDGRSCWVKVGITMQGKRFEKEITLGRMSDRNDVMNALKRMPDTQIREVTFIGERFKAADGGMMAKGGEVRYKLAGNNFGQQIESGKKFAELIKKAYENQTSEHKYPENFIKEIAYTGKIVKNDGTYFLKDYSYKGVLDRFEFLGDKYFLESLKYLNRPTIKNFKFEDGGMMAKGGVTKDSVIRTLTSDKNQYFLEKDNDGYILYISPRGAMNSTFHDKFKVEDLGTDGTRMKYRLSKLEKGGYMAKGGKVKFADKVKSVQESLLKRKKVSPKVQKDYGKTLLLYF